MARRGRPRIEIQRKQFEGLCGIFCTLDEIASVLDCSPDTIERWCKREYGQNFADVFKSKSAAGRVSLRRTAFRQAQTSTAMCIFLLKNYLGLRDNVIVEDTTALDKLDEILGSVRTAAEKE